MFVCLKNILKQKLPKQVLQFVTNHLIYLFIEMQYEIHNHQRKSKKINLPKLLFGDIVGLLADGGALLLNEQQNYG